MGLTLALAATPAVLAQDELPVPEGALTELGDGEGAVDIVAWAGYVEDGSTSPEVDWVTSFEEETGCEVNVTLGNTSDEMFTLMQTGNYDLVSASGDASNRLIASGTVQPINLNLIPNYADVFEGLKNQPHNTVDGVPFGVPHGRGANLLLFNTDEVTPAPDTWAIVWEPDSQWADQVAGKVTAYDSPIYIADAAVYLMATQPELGIQNPYALDETQFAAAVDLAKQQRELIGRYWALYTDEIAQFQGGDSTVGTTWQVIKNVIDVSEPVVPVEAVLPIEGSTGWSDTWMLASESAHPTCGYLFMNHIISPEVNVVATEYFGEAPSNAKACDLNPGHCDTYHATDEDYFSNVWYWSTPQAECLDGRTDVVCTDYSQWTQAWTEIKG
jgi:putative spermidine/putrescine transport system substrate-binding protein